MLPLFVWSIAGVGVVGAGVAVALASDGLSNYLIASRIPPGQGRRGEGWCDGLMRSSK